METTRGPDARHLSWTGLAIAGIATFDWITGEQMSVSLFYLAPIMLITFAGGIGWGVAVATLCALGSAGADWMYAPEHAREAVALWNAVVRALMFSLVAFLYGSLRVRERELARRSVTDPLTELANRRGFDRSLRNCIDLGRRTEQPFDVAYVDLDNFKRLNDRSGHSAGDAALVRAAQALLKHTRASDTVARLGGDEFAIPLNGADAEGASLALARASERLSKPTDSSPPISCTMGIVAHRNAPASMEDALRRADEVIYSTKRTHKGQVVCAAEHSLGSLYSPLAHAA